MPIEYRRYMTAISRDELLLDTPATSNWRIIHEKSKAKGRPQRFYDFSRFSPIIDLILLI